MGIKISLTNHGPDDLRLGVRRENEPVVFLVRIPPDTPFDYDLPDSTSLVVRAQGVPAAEAERRVDAQVERVLTNA